MKLIEESVEIRKLLTKASAQKKRRVENFLNRLKLGLRLRNTKVYEKNETEN